MSIPAVIQLYALDPFCNPASNRGQPVFADRTDGAEKNGAVDNGKAADADDTIRFEAGLLKIRFFAADNYVEIFYLLR